MATGGVITLTGKNITLKRIYGDSSTPPIDRIRIGIDDTTPTESDTDLGFSVPITPTKLNACDTPSDWTGSTDADTPTTNTDTYKPGYGAPDNTSLNLGKSGTTEDFIYYDYNFTAIDMTDTDLLVWIYIADDTTLSKLKTKSDGGLRIYVSSAGFSTDYLYWNAGGSDTLSTGWNLIKVNINSTADGSSGSTDTTSIAYVRLYLGVNNASDTITLGNIIMDYWHYAVRYSDYEVMMVDGYPDYDEVNNIATARYYISSTQAIGYPICEVGEFNSNGEMLGRDVHNIMSKSQTDEIVYIIKHQIE